MNGGSQNFGGQMWKATSKVMGNNCQKVYQKRLEFLRKIVFITSKNGWNLYQGSHHEVRLTGIESCNGFFISQNVGGWNCLFGEIRIEGVAKYRIPDSVFGNRYLVFGSWYLVIGIWYSGFGIRYLEFDTHFFYSSTKIVIVLLHYTKPAEKNQRTMLWKSFPLATTDNFDINDLLTRNQPDFIA